MKHLVGILCLAMLGLAGLSMATVATDDIFSDTDSLLPPVQTWSGKSEALQAGPDDPWITPAEQTGLNSTPDYAETRVCRSVAPRQSRITWSPMAQTQPIFLLKAMVKASRWQTMHRRQAGQRIVVSSYGTRCKLVLMPNRPGRSNCRAFF